MAWGSEIGCGIKFMEMSSGVPKNSLESLGITWAADLNLRLTGIKTIPELSKRGRQNQDSQEQNLFPVC